jgi:hypothetical protein
VVNENRLHELLNECEEHLQRVRRAREVEFNKPLRDRRVNMLIFLDREHAVYSYAVNVLKYVAMVSTLVLILT